MIKERWDSRPIDIVRAGIPIVTKSKNKPPQQDSYFGRGKGQDGRYKIRAEGQKGGMEPAFRQAGKSTNDLHRKRIANS